MKRGSSTSGLKISRLVTFREDCAPFVSSNNDFKRRKSGKNSTGKIALHGYGAAKLPGIRPQGTTAVSPIEIPRKQSSEPKIAGWQLLTGVARLVVAPAWKPTSSMASKGREGVRSLRDPTGRKGLQIRQSAISLGDQTGRKALD